MLFAGGGNPYWEQGWIKAKNPDAHDLFIIWLEPVIFRFYTLKRANANEEQLAEEK